MAKLLVIEDDVEINGLLVRLLRDKGYDVDTAFSGSEGGMILERNTYDLILLDLMLPGLSGEEIIKKLRNDGNLIPIIVISAKIDVTNKVNVLGLGADDFISKPFDNDEVIARIEAHLRRYNHINSTSKSSNIFRAKNIVLDRDQMEVTINNIPMQLTVIEYKILELLMTNPKKVFTKESLFKNIWNDEYFGNDNTVNVHISNLRSKIAKADPDNDYIKTVWGIGFKFIE